jgi:hypothetical protein
MNQAAVNQVNATQLPQPGPGVQVAGTMQMPPQPFTGQGLNVPAAVEQNWHTQIAELGNSAPKLAAYYGNENNPEGGRKVAAELYADQLDKTRRTQDATNLIQSAVSGDKNAVTQLTRDLGSKKEEGSYVKAVLLARLGLTDLAKEEQQKLGGSTTITGMMGRNGASYTVEMASDGSIRRAWDDQGDRVDDKTKAGLQAYALNPKNVTTHTGKVQDKTTGEIYYEQTTPQGIRLVSPSGKTYVGPSENLRAYGIGSDIETKNALQINELQNKLAYAPLNKRLEVIAENEAKYGALDPKVKANILGQSTNVPAPGTVSGTVGQPSAGPAVRPAPATSTETVTPSVTTQPAPNVRPISPQAAAAQTTQAQAAPVTPQPTGAPGVGGTAGGTPAQREANLAIQKAAAEAEIQRQKEVALAQQKPPAEAKGKNEAKDINSQKFADETYKIITPLNNSILQSTGSGLGAKVDDLAGYFGKSTTGAQNIAKLNVLGYQILSQVPRMEGSQSDIDVKMYKQAAGDLADRKAPVETRLAALQAIIEMMKIHDKAQTNNWDINVEKNTPAVVAGTIKKIGNINYVFDGKGWKAQ